MVVRTLPLEYELVIYSGASLRREFRWRPDGGTPQDFTGWSASMLIGPYKSEALYTLSTGTAGLELTTDGIVRLTMTPAQTEAMADENDLAYQLDLVEPDGFVLRFLRGRITVVQDVEPT